MKNLIIVCEEKYRMFGDYLSQLISGDDDTADCTVGTRDGEVAAQVWLEKEYLSNASKVSSEQYLLFIGYDKLIKEKSSHMKVVFSQFGMTYGWLGKQAVLCIEKVVSADRYGDFISFARRYQADVDTLIEKKPAVKLLPEENRVPAKAVLAVIQPVAGAALAAIQPVAGAALAVRQLTQNKKIEAQQYSCAVRKFYVDSLSEFLGI